MSSLNFKTNALQQVYTGNAAGTSTAALINGNTAAGAATMTAFRTNGSDDLDDAIFALDSRIQTFESVITDAAAKAGSNPQTFPYDAVSLKREFMEEVLALLIQRGYTNAGVYNGSLLNDGTITADGQTFSPKNFDALNDAQKKAMLTATGDLIYDQYSDLIDDVFAEGNKLKNNPTDPQTGATVEAVVVTNIPARTIAGTVYDRVTTFGGQTYLIKQRAGATTVDVTKTPVTNVAGQPVDFQLGFSPTALVSEEFLPVNATTLAPTGGASIITNSKRCLSPAQYLYFWNEARIKILRAQLAYKEAITSEIRDDLAKANAAYTDLEQQAGKTRATSADQKTVNPDTSAETLLMDLWEARTANSGSMIFDTNANDDTHNYAEWQTNRSALKTYIDQKSTQSQDAMLDYQTVLNRFNNAYEIMSKLQEKMDGLVKSQLRNVT